MGQFEEYCRSKGIRLEFTMPKTPELNGLAKRMPLLCVSTCVVVGRNCKRAQLIEIVAPYPYSYNLASRICYFCTRLLESNIKTLVGQCRNGQ